MSDIIYIHEYKKDRHRADKEQRGFACQACGLPPGYLNPEEVSVYKKISDSATEFDYNSKTEGENTE